MKSYNFEVAHGYDVLKGFVEAESKEEAIKKIENEEWNDVYDECDGGWDEPVKGYEIINKSNPT